MRPALILGGLFGLLSLGALYAQSPAPAPAIPPPPPITAPAPPPAALSAGQANAAGKKTITAAEVEVRCGGSPQFYATSKLFRGQPVIVLGESQKFPGWLEIKPPEGSFSWINDRFVKRTGPRSGTVIADPATPVPVLAGSLTYKDKPNVETVRVERGTQLVILQETPKYEQGGDAWLPIEPTVGEVRYIPAEAVAGSPGVQLTSAPVGAQVNPGGPTPAQPPRGADDDLMQRIMRLDPAQKRQLLEALGGQPAPAPQAQTQTQSGNGWAGSGYPPAQLASGNRNPPPSGQTTSLYNNPPGAASKAGQLQWSSYGVLRKTALARDGQVMYVLEDPKGAPLVYAVPEQGKTLDPYLGKMVALYGPITYRSDDVVRWYFMTVYYATQPQ